MQQQGAFSCLITATKRLLKFNCRGLRALCPQSGALSKLWTEEFLHTHRGLRQIHVYIYIYICISRRNLLFPNTGQSNSRRSTVCSLPQVHSNPFSTLIWNLLKYERNLPWPDVNWVVIKSGKNCVHFKRLCTSGKKGSFVIEPLLPFVHCEFHVFIIWALYSVFARDSGHFLYAKSSLL